MHDATEPSQGWVFVMHHYPLRFIKRCRVFIQAAVLISLSGCALSMSPEQQSSSQLEANTLGSGDLVQYLNRITWGVTSQTVADVQRAGLAEYVKQQLSPPQSARLPAEIEAQIAAMDITQRPVEALVAEQEQARKAVQEKTGDEERKIAQEAYQRWQSQFARQSATRFLLRALYSPNQLQEHMTWFWLNHFNVHQGKHNLRVMIADYEDRAIRPHALGHFRDLLRAVVYHPVMLRYLDNEQNAVGHINENYARELMELHTLGVDGGYTQHDVQELARVLSGLGVNLGDKQPKVRRELQSQYVRRGLFEFNPNRHDYGDKVLLGEKIRGRGRGLAEVDEVIERLSRHPATARYISLKLAKYFVTDTPSSVLVERMAESFRRTDGDIAAVLNTLFISPAFVQSLGNKFKDPLHYVVSAVRLAYGDKPILNAAPMVHWLNRMGEALYMHPTPDGYPLTTEAWDSSGQMAIRFEIARAIGGGSAGLFRTEGLQPMERPAFPQLANALYYQSLQKGLSPATRQALDQAKSPQEWNMFFLAAPEMMYR